MCILMLYHAFYVIKPYHLLPFYNNLILPDYNDHFLHSRIFQNALNMQFCHPAELKNPVYMVFSHMKYYIDK